jgi:hypothetical protein
LANHFVLPLCWVAQSPFVSEHTEHWQVSGFCVACPGQSIGLQSSAQEQVDQLISLPMLEQYVPALKGHSSAQVSKLPTHNAPEEFNPLI